MPQLSEVQRLQVQVRYKDLELAQIRLEAARGELVRFLGTLDRPGWQLTLAQDGTPSYVEKPKPVEETK